MKQNSIDEEIVAALNFSNFVLLHQCFREINYPLISSTSSTKNKRKQTGKSKIQKVKKKKQNNVQHSNKFESIALESTKQQLYDESQTFSKVKIFADEIDIFSKASFNNNVGNNLYTPSKVNQYTVNDFINQTAISSSKNKFSPINQWKASSAEKYHPNNFQISSHLSYNLPTQNTSNYSDSFSYNFSKKSPQQTKISKENSSTKSASKKGKKFQKCVSKKKVIEEKQNSINTISLANQTNEGKLHQTFKISQNNSSLYGSIYQKQQLSSKKLAKQAESHEQLINGHSQQSFYDNQTRDTCQLTPSKLQKLIEVEDNKYKEMVLKTFYKNQK